MNHRMTVGANYCQVIQLRGCRSLQVSQRLEVVNMSKLKTDFTISFKEVKIALRNLAPQSSAACL